MADTPWIFVSVSAFDLIGAHYVALDEDVVVFFDLAVFIYVAEYQKRGELFFIEERVAFGTVKLCPSGIEQRRLDRGFPFAVIVALFLLFLIGGVIASLTGIVSIPADLGAGGRLCVVMSLSCPRDAMVSFVE